MHGVGVAARFERVATAAAAVAVKTKDCAAISTLVAPVGCKL